MYKFCEILILLCLFTSGFHYGCYCKYSVIYKHSWNCWYSVLGCSTMILLASLWCWRKYKKQKFLYETFYVIFYGSINCLIGAGLLLMDNVELSFYFGFMGMVIVYLPCFNYIALRCDSQGLRPSCMALGNALYFAGLTAGFSLWNDLKLNVNGWCLVGLYLFIMGLLLVNECLHIYKVQDYKKSCDLVYNLLNQERLIYASNTSVKALFVGREDYIFKRATKWLALIVAFIVLVERSLLFSTNRLHLMFSSTLAFLHYDYSCLAFLCYTGGCVLGAALMLRFQPKLIYMFFGLIEISTSAAALLVYNFSQMPQNCFLFLCFNYLSKGVYSSVGLQMLVECSPFLYTELFLSIAYSLELLATELFKYEVELENWSIVLGRNIIDNCLTLLCIVLVLLYLPKAKGLVEIRNNLLGIYRRPHNQLKTHLHRNISLYLEMPNIDGKLAKY